MKAAGAVDVGGVNLITAADVAEAILWPDPIIIRLMTTADIVVVGFGCCYDGPAVVERVDKRELFVLLLCLLHEKYR